MSKFIDLTGQRFGKLVVLKRVENNKYNQVRFLCRCDCGKEITVNGGVLRRGQQSCGCQALSNRRKSLTTHGKTHTRLFNIWQNIRSRCYTETNPSYKYYGGLGIRMCDVWRNDFKAFCDWAYANGYTDKLTIDRINVNGNYEPSNCRWVTWKEQSLNKHDTHFLEYKGTKKPLAVWAREKDINPATLLFRIKRGWSIEKALETKVGYKNGK